MRVYPVPGRLVRDPISFEPVPADGRDVADTDFHYVRALADGDVGLAPPAAARRQSVRGAGRTPSPAPSSVTAEPKGAAQ